MYYYFLKKDIIALEKKINEVLEETKEAGKKIGESCEVGADTWHDNFDYEEAVRQMSMVSSHLKQLTNIRNKAKVISPNKSNDKVSIGKTAVCLVDGQEIAYTIGSYIILKDKANEQSNQKIISYISPIAKLLIHHSVGEICEGLIGKNNKKFKIISIS